MKALAVALLLPVVAVLAGCSTTKSLVTEPLEIRFDARIGDRGLRCGEHYSGVGASRAEITLQDFRVYVSNVSLVDRAGAEHPVELVPDGAFQSARVALLDFEDATGNCNGNAPTHTSIRMRAPAGDFVGLAFDIGVPVDLNHQDPTLAPAPLNFSGLSWPWRYGYKFTTIDLETGATAAGSAAHSMHGAGGSSPYGSPHGAAPGFSIHLGSVDCGDGSPRTPPESPCATPNRPHVVLSKFDVRRDVVVMDLGALLAGTDVTVNAPGTASGCMSGPDDDDCVGIMERFGLPFRDRAAVPQTFVRARPR